MASTDTTDLSHLSDHEIADRISQKHVVLRAVDQRIQELRDEQRRRSAEKNQRVLDQIRGR